MSLSADHRCPARQAVWRVVLLPPFAGSFYRSEQSIREVSLVGCVARNDSPGRNCVISKSVAVMTLLLVARFLVAEFERTEVAFLQLLLILLRPWVAGSDKGFGSYLITPETKLTSGLVLRIRRGYGWRW